MKIAAYPDVLKNSNWQKHKGIVTKLLKKETGIGRELDECQKNYNALAALAGQHADGTPVSPALKNAAALFGTSCMSVCDLAHDEAVKWSSKLSPVPKDTRIYAEKISSSAEQFAKSIVTMLT